MGGNKGIIWNSKNFYEILEFQGLNWNIGGNKGILRNSMNFEEILWISMFELEYGRKKRNSMKFNEFIRNPMNSIAWIGICEEIKEFYEIQWISRKS